MQSQNEANKKLKQELFKHSECEIEAYYIARDIYTNQNKIGKLANMYLICKPFAQDENTVIATELENRMKNILAELKEMMDAEERKIKKCFIEILISALQSHDTHDSISLISEISHWHVSHVLKLMRLNYMDSIAAQDKILSGVRKVFNIPFA